MKIHKLIKQAKELGACNGAIQDLLSCTSYEEIKSDKERAFAWVMWATDEELIPSKFLEAYRAIVQPAREAYGATTQSAREAYKAVERPAWEAYKATTQPAWEAYKAVERSAREAYEATKQSALTQMLDDIETWIEAQ